MKLLFYKARNSNVTRETSWWPTTLLTGFCHGTNKNINHNICFGHCMQCSQCNLDTKTESLNNKSQRKKHLMGCVRKRIMQSFQRFSRTHMNFHPDRAEGSHSLSTSSVIWEQTDDQGSSTSKGHARTKTTTTVDKMQCFSSSFTFQALWSMSAHIPNLRSLPHRWERAEDTWEKELSRGQRGGMDVGGRSVAWVAPWSLAFARLLARGFAPEGGRNVCILGRGRGGKFRMDLISEQAWRNQTPVLVLDWFRDGLKLSKWAGLA
jgi:hypothetical protein